MHDELHAARFVEEAFQHDGVLRRQTAERGVSGGKILDQLFRGGRDYCELIDQPAQSRLAGRIATQVRRDVRA